MAKFFPAFLFLLSLCVSTHVQARESQFFNKFSANAGVKDAKTETVTTQEPVFAEKQAQETPAFVAQGKNGYGLYGHETGELPGGDVATTASFADEPYYNKGQNYNGFYGKDAYANDEELARDTKAMLQGSSYTTAAETEDNGFDNVAETSLNGNHFPAEQQRFTNARLQGSSYTTGGSTSVNGRNNYYTGGNRYTVNGGQNVQKQGMSDTRFLENGKYFYAIDNEEKYNPNRYAESRNAEFNTQGYLPNSNGNNYDYSNRNTNNANSYNGNYNPDNFAAENAKAMAGGYDPVKNQYVFRASGNTQAEFNP
ncbi:hypothetical protein MLD38_037047 [Melastoma candidum]|uniref:Uncharacterized protein n=1 Tax=Melastoma candidum TaxID=119954 RepID=A0ACB9LLH8_9MYRT|nr:hypothetical protein MLD38_037047 [Melastoma candidum]